MEKKNFIITVILLSIAIAGIYFFNYLRGDMVVVEKNFNKLPHQIGRWRGVDETFSDDIYKELRADENLYRIYTRDDGAQLGLYIGYYGTQRGGHPDHVPTGCYPGSGWGIDAITPYTITAKDSSCTITVNNLYAKKESRAEQTFYWLQNFRGTVTRLGIEQNIEKIKTKILYNRNDGAFIRVNAAVKGSRQETIAFLEDFISELMPLLPHYWPIEAIVS